METEYIRTQPHDVLRALWVADRASEQLEIKAWLEHEFRIEEPYARALEHAEVTQ